MGRPTNWQKTNDMKQYKHVNPLYGAINFNGDMLTIHYETIPRQEMKKIVKKYQGVNRIHKPMALLWYTDCMNGKSKNWKT